MEKMENTKSVTNECARDSKQQEDLELIAKSEIEFEKYAGKTVFVTGATGLIGSSLVKTLLCINRLRGCNIKIIAAVRNREKVEHIFENLINRKELTLYVGDIICPISIDEKIDYIFHTVSITTSKTMVEHPVMTIETSYQGTKNVLELAKQKDIEGMVYVSSMEIYGIPDRNLNDVSEKDLGYIDIDKVRSSYSEGKRICECLCNAYAGEYGVAVLS